jgi:cold shock CspA family protein
MRASRMSVLGLMASFVLSAAAHAAAPPAGPPGANTAPIAGTIEKWDGKALTVKTASGPVTVKVGADAPIMTRKPAKLSDIGPNTFLGTTTVPRNGRLEAIEVHLFPESMRGAGEGHYPWQGEPGSMMTNGAVTTMTNGSVASIAKGGVMKVAYKDGDKGRGEKDVYVPADVSVTAIERLDASALKPGTKVNGQVQQNADGSVSATRLNIVP